MGKLTTTLLCCGFFLLPVTVSAYIGPGAGLSLLGALWALLVAVATALIFVLAWPMRTMLRRKREAKEREAKELEANELEASELRESAGFAASDTAPQRDDITRTQRQ